MESTTPKRDFLDQLEPIGTTPDSLEAIAVKLSGRKLLTRAEQNLAELYKPQIEVIIDAMGSTSIPLSDDRDTISSKLDIDPFLNPKSESTPPIQVESTLPGAGEKVMAAQEIADAEIQEYAIKHNINTSTIDRLPEEELVGGVTIEEANKVFGIVPEEKVTEKKLTLPGLGSVGTTPLSSEQIIKNAITQTIPQSSKKDELLMGVNKNALVEPGTKINNGDGSLEKLTDIVNASQNRIAELEIKLSSDEFSDAEKGLFEEEHSVLKQIIELNKKPEKGAHSESEQKIKDAIEAVASGTTDSVTIELEAASEYIRSLNALTAVAKNGAHPEISKAIDAEYASAAPKFNRAEASQVALAHLKEQLGAIDPLQNIAEYNKVEKKIATLEKISGDLEKVTQKKDRNFAERGLDFLKNNIAEKWRTGKWYTKVGAGIALAGAGLAAATIGSPALISAVGIASLGLRGLGMYGVYQGVKNSEVAKLGNVDAFSMIEKVFETGTDAEKAKAIDQIIAENTWSRKGLFWGGVVALVSLSAPLMAHSDTVLSALGIEHAGAAAPEAIAAGAGTTTPDAAALIPGGMSEQVFTHATVTVQEGDTMYKILAQEFDISKHVEKLGGQYNAIENILTQIKADPAAFGIVSGNVDKLAVGDTINIAKISEIVTGSKMTDGLSIFDHANKLPAAVVTGIENYMPAGSKAILAAAAEQKVAVATETAANTAGSVAAAPVAENITPAPTNPLSTPEVQPVKQPSNIVGETAPTTIENTAVVNPENSVDISKAYTDIALVLNSKGLGPEALQKYGAMPVWTFMSNPGTTPEAIKMAEVISAYAQNTKLPIPDKGTVLQYLIKAATPTGSTAAFTASINA